MTRYVHWAITVAAQLDHGDGRDSQVFSRQRLLIDDEIADLVILRRDTAAHIQRRRETLDYALSPMFTAVNNELELHE